MAQQLIFGGPTGGSTYGIGWNYDHYPQEELTKIEADVLQVMSRVVPVSFRCVATATFTALHSVWNELCMQ